MGFTIPYADLLYLKAVLSFVITLAGDACMFTTAIFFLSEPTEECEEGAMLPLRMP